jgi:hypothetical protein
MSSPRRLRSSNDQKSSNLRFSSGVAIELAPYPRIPSVLGQRAQEGSRLLNDVFLIQGRYIVADAFTNTEEAEEDALARMSAQTFVAEMDARHKILLQDR